MAISFVGSSSTDSGGQVELKITYGQNVASWLEFNILVAASGVAGTEGRTSYPGRAAGLWPMRFPIPTKSLHSGWRPTAPRPARSY